LPADGTVADRGVVSLPGSPRLPYGRLPAGLLAEIDLALGSPVVAVSPRQGGFSPGPAVIVTCADGHRAFVKAVGTPLNPETPDLVRTEAAVTGQLPSSLPVPRLRAHVEWAEGDDQWVALVFDVFDGESAPLPWTAATAALVVDGLTELARAATPCPIERLPTPAERLGESLTAWPLLAAQPPADLDPWELAHLDWLAGTPDRLAAAGGLAGDTLAHLDLRADNMLLGTDGSVAFVDWAWAARGADWVDTVLFALDAATQGGVDPDWLVGRSPLVAAADPRQVTDLVLAMTGMWASDMRRPAPPGLPTLRAFQRRFHDAALAWGGRRVAAGLA
jgi:hypothetical protein